MLLSELAELDIAILGAGREGLSAWHWLRKHFPEKVINIYAEQPGNDEQKAIIDDPYVHLVNGAFDIGQLARHDLLIRSPGISPYRSELVELRRKGVQFSSASSLWFSQHPDARTICITGTKGKSTTAALVAHLLRAGGLNVQLAGNIGLPLLDCTDEQVDWWVIELSSYQLVDLEARPGIAAILNLTDEHLDWHGGSNNYRNDKLRIAELAGDAPLIVNHGDELLVRHLSACKNLCWFNHKAGFHVASGHLWQGEICFDDLPRHQLRGSHNLLNLAAALTIVEQAGGSVSHLAETLQSFKSLPHRLQSLGQIDAVDYVNDSLSTTPVASLAALEAFKGKRIILLVGGMDRGVDWRPMMPQMKELEPFAVICLPDNGPQIAKILSASGLCPAGGIQCATSLADAMNRVSALVQAGDTVLLSPGAASFPHFRDYEDRGKQFAELAGFNTKKPLNR